MIGKAVRSVIVGIRRVAESTVAVADHRTVAGLTEHLSHRYIEVIVDIAVVAGDINLDGLIFIVGRTVVAGDRRIVDRINSDRQRARVAKAGAIANLVIETVGTVEVRIGRIGKGSIAVVDDAAAVTRSLVRNQGNAVDMQHIFRIAVVYCDIDNHWGVFRRAFAIGIEYSKSHIKPEHFKGFV